MAGEFTPGSSGCSDKHYVNPDWLAKLQRAQYVEEIGPEFDGQTAYTVNPSSLEKLDSLTPEERRRIILELSRRQAEDAA